MSVFVPKQLIIEPLSFAVDFSQRTRWEKRIWALALSAVAKAILCCQLKLTAKNN